MRDPAVMDMPVIECDEDPGARDAARIFSDAWLDDDLVAAETAVAAVVIDATPVARATRTSAATRRVRWETWSRATTAARERAGVGETVPGSIGCPFRSGITTVAVQGTNAASPIDGGRRQEALVSLSVRRPPI